MHAPTPEEVEANMIENMGELPAQLKSAKAIDPRFLVEQAMSTRFSMKDEANPLGMKTSLMIMLAVSIVNGSEECEHKQTQMLKNKWGMTREELAYLVKVIKHAQGNVLMGRAKTAFDSFLE